MTVTLDHLNRLYAHTDDPWNFANSDYERQKFVATRNALRRERYTSALELGCGNGMLASYIVPRCRRYTGVDAVERAVEAARARVPHGDFVQACYPCRLPGEDYDLVILSEVLYFLSSDDIAQLTRDLAEVAPRAEVICTTYLGETEQVLQGIDALEAFRAGMRGRLDLEQTVDNGTYRIDRGTMRGQFA